jgi:hypothetical protein
MQVITKASNTEIKITTITEDEVVVSYNQLLTEQKIAERRLAAAQLTLDIITARIAEAVKLGIK